MRSYPVYWLTCLLLVLASSARAAESVGNTTFILDCSQDMSRPLEGDEQAESRMSIARQSLLTALRELSSSKQAQASVWLFGHRLAWEQDAVEPGLVEQADFLAQTNGFNVLSHLIPGDDVQAVRSYHALRVEHVESLEVLLHLVRPWGEKPLYLALAQAVESQPFGKELENRRIVVITQGEHHQGFCRYPSTVTSVLEALDRHPVPIHLVVLTPEDQLEPTARKQLKLIAEKSGGGLHFATSGSQCGSALQTAMRATSAQPAETDTLAAGVPVAKDEPPTTRAVEGQVIFYNHPLRNADVTLEGNGRQLSTSTDREGRFRFEPLPTGKYLVRVEGIAKNRFRRAEKPLVIDKSGTEPVAIQVQAE